MAVLRDKTGDVALTLRPYRVTEDGEPTWILTQLELRRDGAKLLSTTFSITRDDLAALRDGLNDFSAACREAFALTTTDEDFVLHVQRRESPGDIAIGFWTGEPYALMKGYRFVAVADELERFAGELRFDEHTAVTPRT